MADIKTDAIWLTQETYDKLRQEYDYLSGEGRAQVIAKIASTREEGDLSENGGYHAAREEQGQIEARIRVLKDMLERAQIGEPEGDPTMVEPGKLVTVSFFGDDDDTETFLLGSRAMVGLDESLDVAVYSPQSPLGAAIVGKHIGDEAVYTAPNGKPITVVIKAVDAPPTV